MTRRTFAGGPADFAVDLSSADSSVRLKPNATLTAWNAREGGVQLTDLVTELGATVSELTTDGQGRIPRFSGPDSVTELWIDSGSGARYLLTTTDVGPMLLAKQDRTDAPAAHTHSPSDVPGIGQAVGNAVAYAYFNEAANTWPARPDTDGPVIWIGSAVRPASTLAVWGLDYIDQQSVAPSTNIPDPTPEPEEGEPNADGVILSAPVRSGAGSSVTLDADVADETGHRFTYLQIVVRGPDGQAHDVAHSPGTVLAADGETHLTGSFTAPVGGSWRAHVSYNLTGGSAASDWIAGPVTTFTVTMPTPGTNTFPQAGLSSLDWNSGMFPRAAHGAQWEPASVTAAGAYRDNPSDTMLVFAQRNTGWGGAGNPTGLLSWYDPWGTFPGILIVSLPPQPEPESNASTAAGSNNSRWRDYGSLLASKGQNISTRVLRLGWECNGNWYAWSWHKGGPDQFIAAYKNVVTSVRQTAPNVKFNLCLNKDWVHPSKTWQAVLTELRDYFDVVGLDAYDMFDGWRDDNTRRTAWYNKSGPQRNSVASWCRSNGKLMSLDEWALVAQASAGSSGTGGGDDELYITDTFAWCQANADVLAWESYYDHAGAPPDLLHTLSSYPGAEAEYLDLWGS